ncbi:YopX family protein [Streptococcus dysgalactiae]|uniref:YopX family protein n=1 Tax=Streptococcus dysgalactiae TaxID=1334 RepID=UPI000651527C|nr:YopX family protein [Streptococcus dysgalactiae]
MIKFRAWDKVANVMIYNIEQTYDGLGYFQENEDIEDYVSDISFGCFADWLENDQFVIMQSTGLFDKNGVEIFDGDVVRYTWDMLSDPNATEKGKKVRISKVFWSDWRASWAVGKKFCNNDLFTYARNGNTVEVIGNIYQNSDLLESVKE